MNQYQWLDAFLLSMPGAEKDYKAEWGWFRYRVCQKMFAAVCTPDASHAVHKGRTMVILKCEPQLAELLREQYADIIPGFYCDKRNWNSVYLDGQVPDDVMRMMCREAYTRLVASLPRRLRDTLPSGGQNQA